MKLNSLYNSNKISYDFDDKWKQEWLNHKLRVNFIGAIIAILVISITEDIVFFINKNSSGTRVLIISLILFLGLIFQIIMLIRYGGFDYKWPKYLNSKRKFFAWKWNNKEGPVTLFGHPELIRTTHLEYYPVWRTIIETFVLFVICRQTGYIYSPYIALFILYTSLAAFVLDKFFADIFYFLIFIVLTWFLDSGSNYFYIIILIVATCFTGFIIKGLINKLVNKVQSNINELNTSIDKALESWKDEKHIYNYQSEYGNFHIHLKGKQKKIKIDPEEIIFLIPHCLRSEKCGYSDTQSVNKQCDVCNSEYCDVGFIVKYCQTKNIFWNIVGESHKLDNAFNDFKKNKPQCILKHILGICCVGSFFDVLSKICGIDNNKQNETEKHKWQGLIDALKIETIIFVKLAEYYNSCPSKLKIPVVASSKITTNIYREEFLLLMNKKIS